MFGRDEIFRFLPDLGGGKGLGGVAARFCRLRNDISRVKRRINVG
jgi:hypothetical protein